MNRREDIECSFVGNDRIWPPHIGADLNHPFMKALLEVLDRLPDEAYNITEDQVSFVVEDLQILACNAPFERDYPPNSSSIKVRYDTIVIFHKVLSFSHSAIVGLLAHEIAHSFVSGNEYKTDEMIVDKQIRNWGFDRELDQFEYEKNEMKPDFY